MPDFFCRQISGFGDKPKVSCPDLLARSTSLRTPRSGGGDSFAPEFDEPEQIGRIEASELQKDYDLVVIGGGPVGVAAALKAATLGRRAVLVDKPRVQPTEDGLDIAFGGPTGLFGKSLREAGKCIDVSSLQSMQMYDHVIWSQVRGMCERLASMNAQHQVQLMQEFKVGYLQGHAFIIAPNKVLAVCADGKHSIITTEKILIATGSKPIRPDSIPFDDTHIFDSDSINGLAFLPKNVVISGAGIIAIEYAKIFRKLGADVTLLVRSSVKSTLDRIGLDPDVADQMIMFMEKDNVKIYEGTEVERYDLPAEAGEVTLGLKSKCEAVPNEVTCDVFLAAVGRRPKTSSLGLDKLGLKVNEKGGNIEVDGNFETSIPGIYAAGDVIGAPMLASTGVYQGQGAVLAMFEEGHATARSSFPVGMWTTPECAYYGLTKAAAEKNGLEVEEGLASYTACLRGRVFHPEGILKLVFQKEDGVIVGVHMIGADACELVHYGMDLVEQRVTIFSLISKLFTAVTYHELFKEAALDGNTKLTFGAQWQAILGELGALACHPDFNEEVMRREFDRVDTDGSGSLSAEELLVVFQHFDKNVKRGTILNLVRLADDDGNGTIEWEEFSTIYQVIARCGHGQQVQQASKESAAPKEPPAASVGA